MSNIISGRVGDDGSIWAGTGFEVEIFKGYWGEEELGYKITFPDLKEPPIVIAQAWETDEIVSCVTLTAYRDPASVLIATIRKNYSGDDYFEKNTFSFIAVTVD